MAGLMEYIQFAWFLAFSILVLVKLDIIHKDLKK